MLPFKCPFANDEEVQGSRRNYVCALFDLVWILLSSKVVEFCLAQLFTSAPQSRQIRPRKNATQHEIFLPAQRDLQADP